MLQLGWIMFIAEHIVVAMPSTVKDDELLAALRVTGCHQSGGLVAIYDIGLGFSFHREQISVIPNLQQFIASGRTQCHGGQAFLCPLLHMAGEPGRIFFAHRSSSLQHPGHDAGHNQHDSQ